MAFLNVDELKILRDLLHLPKLEVVIQAHWGSSHPNHREEIHGELKKRMATAYPLSDSSIAHCKDWGGFIFSPYDSEPVIRLGFDMELDSRVSAETAMRVCASNEEFSRAPSPASLWTAKEAAFKSLKGPQQPPVLSYLELGQWQFHSQFETVSILHPEKFGAREITGAILKKNSHCLAFFVCRA